VHAPPGQPLCARRRGHAARRPAAGQLPARGRGQPGQE
jgi:hypothetical protein